MQLAGPGVFGPPRDRDGALAVLRAAVAGGVNHIDTSDFYGPHVTNQLIREALHPYPDDLVIVTKVGARRGTDAIVELPAFSAEGLESAVHDNLRNLGLDVLDVVNLRVMFESVRTGRRLDRGAADGAGRAAAPGAGPPYRPEQRDADAGRGGARHRGDRLRAEPVQPGAPRRRRAGRRPCRRGHRLRAVLSAGRVLAVAVGGTVRRRQRRWAPRRCRSRWLGCCNARRTSC